MGGKKNMHRCHKWEDLSGSGKYCFYLFPSFLALFVFSCYSDCLLDKNTCSFLGVLMLHDL